MKGLFRFLLGICRSLRGNAQQPGRHEQPRTAADQYYINEANCLEYIGMIDSIILRNIENKNHILVAENYGVLASSHTHLGLLHWRHGLDPRPDFEKGIAAYERMSALAREHQLPKNIAAIPDVYAMLSLMGHKTAIAFEDEDYHRQHRWPCYECCIVHVLHDQLLDEHHTKLLDQYLERNKDRADLTVLTYLQLLGVRPSDLPRDELVKLADTNWMRRRGNMFFNGGGPAWFGYGVMNHIYVDIYLAAVLHKIGWGGEGVHRWRW